MLCGEPRKTLSGLNDNLATMKTKFIFFGLLFSCLTGNSQNQTRTQNKPVERESAATHKIMLIPFETKLYMSEVDRSINAETKLSSKESVSIKTGWPL